MVSETVPDVEAWCRGRVEALRPLLFHARIQFCMANENNVYQAEYIGSGTFIIHKPKRKKSKLRQSRVKSPQRGARK